MLCREKNDLSFFLSFFLTLDLLTSHSSFVSVFLCTYSYYLLKFIIFLVLCYILIFHLNSLHACALLVVHISSSTSLLSSVFFSDCTILTCSILHVQYYLSFNECCESRRIASVIVLGSRLFAESALRPRFFVCNCIQSRLYLLQRHPSRT